MVLMYRRYCLSSAQRATALGAYFAWRHKRELRDFIESLKAKDKDQHPKAEPKA